MKNPRHLGLVTAGVLLIVLLGQILGLLTPYWALVSITVALTPLLGWHLFAGLDNDIAYNTMRICFVGFLALCFVLFALRSYSSFIG
jgi:hypothetical protein